MIATFAGVGVTQHQYLGDLVPYLGGADAATVYSYLRGLEAGR